MAINYSDLAQPKPEPRARVKARRQRHAKQVVQSVRARCVERDGYCRVENSFALKFSLDECEGESEWAHLGDKKRFKTRGKPAEERHTTAGSLMLCARHHAHYDLHMIEIRPRTDRGADGPLEFTAGRVQVFEVEGRNS